MQGFQPGQPLESSGKIAFREGLYLGLILGALHLVLSLFSSFVATGATGLLVFLAILIVWLGAFFLAGMRASKRTALVGTGTLAGLWTGVMGGLLGFVVNMIMVVLQVDLIREAAQRIIDQQNMNFQYTNGSLLAIYALLNICLWVVGIGVAAGIGALGGLAGRSRSPLKPYFYAHQQPPFPPHYPPHPEGVPYPPQFEQTPPPYPPTPPPSE